MPAPVDTVETDGGENIVEGTTTAVLNDAGEAEVTTAAAEGHCATETSRNPGGQEGGRPTPRLNDEGFVAVNRGVGN